MPGELLGFDQLTSVSIRRFGLLILWQVFLRSSALLPPDLLSLLSARCGQTQRCLGMLQRYQWVLGLFELASLSTTQQQVDQGAM